MNSEPTARLVERAAQAARSGNVRSYLLDSAGSPNRVNEKTLRQGFARMRDEASICDQTPVAADLMRDLNGYYRTRFSVDKLARVVPVVYAAIASEGWWKNPPTHIGECSGPVADSLSALVTSALHRTEESGLNRPYSLLTKFLHFSFPDTFGIYDAQAASSIQTWAYFSFPLSNDEWKRFAWGTIANTDGSGYGAVLEFYRLCWASAGDERLADLRLAAQELSDEIDAPVSPLYVIDNLLWHAGGDPRVLGLL